MAELAGLPILTMDWHSLDAVQAFKKFKAQCELYFSGPLKEKSEEEQNKLPTHLVRRRWHQISFHVGFICCGEEETHTYWTRFEN